jgi:hypothetical protein
MAQVCAAHARTVIRQKASFPPGHSDRPCVGLLTDNCRAAKYQLPSTANVRHLRHR